MTTDPRFVEPLKGISYRARHFWTGDFNAGKKEFWYFESNKSLFLL